MSISVDSELAEGGKRVEFIGISLKAGTREQGPGNR
jgi:hypothetical protein